MLKFLLKRKVIVGLFVTFIFAFGFYGINNLDKELFPEVTFNQTMIMVETEEMPAEDVEKFVTIPIEQALNGIEGIKHYESSSTMTGSAFLIELDGENASDISKEIEGEINRLQGNLYGVKETTVMQATTSGAYEMFLDISGATEQEMSDYATGVVQPRLEALPEVRDVQIIGLEEKAIHITPQTNKLEEYGLQKADIFTAMEQANQSIALGTLAKEAGDPTIRWDTSFSSIEDIKNVPIETNNGAIKLMDVAKVSKEQVDQTASAWKNGDTNFLIIQIGRANGVSQIDMANAVRKEIDLIKNEVNTPAEINEIAAQADYVEEAIDGVTSNIIIGGIIAIIVLLLFLRNIRATIIIGLSIPASILLTILTMTLLGYSFNLLSLIGLGLGIGMMVDASIVVLESIFRKKELGYPALKAVISGTKEVVGAVISSALTTIVVFLPIVLLDEEIGKMVIVLTVVIAITLISSVIISFTLIPTLSENFLQVKKEKKIRLNLINKYGTVLEWITKKKRRRIGIIGFFLVVFMASFLLVTKIPATFMPDILNRYAEVFVELEPGVSKEKRAEIASKMNEEFSQIADIETNIVLNDTESLFAIINMTPENEKTMEQAEVNKEIFASLRRMEKEYPIASTGAAMEGMTNPPIEIYVTGENLDTLQAIGKQVVAELEELDAITSTKLQLGDQEKEYIINIDEKELEKDNVPQAYLYENLSQLFTDQALGELAQDGATLPIMLKSSITIDNRQELLEQKIMTASGEKKLSNFVSLTAVNSPAQIDRNDGERYLTVNADYETDNLSNIHSDINRILKDLELDKGYSAAIAGDLEEQQQAATDLIIIFIISLFLVFVVMAVQFNSLKHPIIILFIIPLTLTGVLIGLFITQKELNILSAIGVIMLIGIVINNGILLIDRTRQLREQNMNVSQAIVQAGKERIRPIFMTTLTTVGGMLPLALATGTSSGYQSPLAVVIISGLLFSTFITLLLIPAIYLTFEDIGNGMKRLFSRKKQSDHKQTHLTG